MTWNCCVSEGVKGDVNERPSATPQATRATIDCSIVRYAAGDLDGADSKRPALRSTNCADCARLAADIESPLHDISRRHARAEAHARLPR